MKLGTLLMATWLGCAGRTPAPQAVVGPDGAAAPSAAPDAPSDSDTAAAQAAAARAAATVAPALARLDAELAALAPPDDGPSDGAPPPDALPADPPQVAALLAGMVAVDQRLRVAVGEVPDGSWSLGARLAWVEGVETRIDTANRAHTDTVRALIDRHGWFDIGRFGAIADQDGWILVQHADHDPGFQQEVLDILADRVEAGQSDPARYAYLYDRVQAQAGQPQRYGTQGRCVAKGAWEPLPLELPEYVDRLRAEVGLGTLKAYQAQVASLCP